MNGQTGAYGAQPRRDPNAILNECRDIDRGIDSIHRNLALLRKLQGAVLSDTDPSQGSQSNRELDSLSSETMTLYRSFAARIKTIKSQKESGDPRNKPQVGLVDRKLKSAINEYQNVEKEYRQQLSAQMERQYRIVRPDASDQEVREAVQDTSNNQVFSQAVCHSNAQNRALANSVCSYCLPTAVVNPNQHCGTYKADTRIFKRLSGRWWSSPSSSRTWKRRSLSKNLLYKAPKRRRRTRSSTWTKETNTSVEPLSKQDLQGGRSGYAFGLLVSLSTA